MRQALVGALGMLSNRPAPANLQAWDKQAAHLSHQYTNITQTFTVPKHALLETYEHSGSNLDADNLRAGSSWERSL